MYSEQFKKSLKAVEAAREANIAYEPARMTADEKDALLAAYHPDYKKSEFSTLSIGPNKGEKVPHELCEMLEANSRIKPSDVDLEDVKYDVDVLIIGGGGAGASAAIEADNAGAKVMIVTKLRIGDANTMMAEGGIQAADKPNDSPATHFLDAFGGGHFAAKRELINVFLATNDRIIVVDPMGEYAPLVRRLGGQVIEIAPDSPHHISPMDLQMNINDEDSPLSMKADFLLSLCELIVGGKEGLQPIEKTVIDRCVRLVYREMALGLETTKTPLLQDLYEELLRQPEPEARRVATALELYCTGSLNLFNHPTNVDLNSRVVCIVLKGLGENLRKIAMHTTNEFVTAAVNANHAEGVATWCYFDEFHILLRDPLTASYFVAVWKMLRKKGCVPSALTQNVKVRPDRALCKAV